MRPLPRKLLEFWYPDYLKSDQSVEVYLRFIVGLSVIGMAVELIYLVLNLLKGIPIFPTNLPLLAFLGLLITVRYSRSYAMAAHSFIVVFFLTLAMLCTYYQSFPYTILLWTPVFANVSNYLVGNRLGGLWALVMASFVVVLVIYVQPGSDFGIKLTQAQLGAATIVSVILTMGSALYSSMLFRDTITRLNAELARKNLALSQRQRQVEEIVTKKEMLISLVCHDIANPLRAIDLAVGSAQANQGEDSSEVFAMVGRCTRIISEIIDEVSRMQAIEMGKAKVELRPVDLLKVIERMYWIFSDRLKAKNLQLIFEKNFGEQELFVEADEHSLTNSVLSNLISNAIKFSEPNQPIILQVMVNDGVVRLLIKDFGIGMPPNLLDDLFKNYKKTSRVGTGGERGTGFGLPITKVYMDQYGGVINVSSKEKSFDSGEHGTTIELHFRRSVPKKFG